MQTLYICYFGLREPLVQTQVLPYLRALSDAGIGVQLLTFEPNVRHSWSQRDLDEEKIRLSNQGIEWLHLRYHKRPSLLATTADIFAGAWMAARLGRRRKLDVLHARAHVPLAMALLARIVSSPRLIFDLRGLMAEEYADAGVWSANSFVYRSVKWLERLGVQRADGIVVLTERMRRRLIAEQAVDASCISVIPCCVDFSRYDLSQTDRRESFDVVYAGSVTGLYLLEEMARFFAELRAREPRAFLRVFTTSSKQDAARRLVEAGLAPDEFQVLSVAPLEVPRELQTARLGLSFRKPAFSQIAASPTKIAEYLAAGLPVVSNSGIGDTDCLLQTEGVGVQVCEFTREEYARAAEAALKLTNEAGIVARCIAVARKHFDLSTVGGPRYIEAYKRLAVTAEVQPKVSRAR